MENSLKEIVLEKKNNMLPTKEQQEEILTKIINKQYDISYYNSLEQSNNLSESDIEEVVNIYAKWYAVQVIKHCAEVAESKLVYHSPTEDPHDEVDKQSILNVINEL